MELGDPTLEQLARLLPGSDGVSGLVVEQEWTLVATYPKEWDGTECAVYVSRMPALFWRILVPAWDMEITTGSGVAELVDHLASAIQRGMVVVRHASQSEAEPSGRML